MLVRLRWNGRGIDVADITIEGAPQPISARRIQQPVGLFRLSVRKAALLSDHTIHESCRDGLRKHRGRKTKTKEARKYKQQGCRNTVEEKKKRGQSSSQSFGEKASHSRGVSALLTPPTHTHTHVVAGVIHSLSLLFLFSICLL
jgi:hypothetical protein